MKTEPTYAAAIKSLSATTRPTGRRGRRVLLAGGAAALLALAVGPRAQSKTAEFFEDGVAPAAIAKLQEKLPTPTRVLRVDFERDVLIVQVQDPATPAHVDAYTYTPVAGGGAISGPEPVEISRTISNLDESLFNLSDVNFGALAGTVRDALRRAALDGGGAVESVHLQRRIVLLPRNHATDIECSISLRGPRETATAYADAQGRLSYVDLKNTARARAINYLEGGKALDDALAFIHGAFGDGRVFQSVEIITPAYLMFRAQDPKEPHVMKDYTCDINGISQPLHMGFQPKEMFPPGLFGFEDMDWSRYAAMKQAAIEKLGIPDGRVTLVKVSRPTGPGGPQPLQWEMNVRGKEDGSVQFDQQGALVRSKASRR